MSDQDSESRQGAARILDLKGAIERIRNVQAERSDVVVDMKQAAFSRLELLAQDLAPVFSQVPSDIDLFDFGLTNGETPRLWIDMTTSVRMGRDRRTYEFVKDTRLGRTLLMESDSRTKIGRAVTDYVAERIVERERAVEGDWLALKPAPERKAGQGPAVGWMGWAAWRGPAIFLAGMLAGAIALLGWVLFGPMPNL
jgi:hypothetical protein